MRSLFLVAALSFLTFPACAQDVAVDTDGVSVNITGNAEPATVSIENGEVAVDLQGINVTIQDAPEEGMAEPGVEEGAEASGEFGTDIAE